MIGSKFVVDPSLRINLNGQQVELMSLEGLKTIDIPVEGHGTVTVHFIDSIEHHRSAKLRGISWWVNQRRVGEPNWDRLDEEGGEKTTIIPMVYETVLLKARQRTFNLQKRLQEAQPEITSDPEVDEVLHAVRALLAQSLHPLLWIPRRMEDRIDVDRAGLDAVENHVRELPDACSARIFPNELKCLWTTSNVP